MRTERYARSTAPAVREAMRSGDLAPFGSNGGAVEVDETYFGVRKGAKISKGGHSHKPGVLALADRDSGSARTVGVCYSRGMTDKPEPSQLDKCKQAARDLECDDDETRFRERVGKLVEKPGEPEPPEVGEYCPPDRRGG